MGYCAGEAAGSIAGANNNEWMKDRSPSFIQETSVLVSLAVASGVKRARGGGCRSPNTWISRSASVLTGSLVRSAD